MHMLKESCCENEANLSKNVVPNEKNVCTCLENHAVKMRNKTIDLISHHL